jgi:Fuc2NAc and GlcNAc transferase
MPTHLLSQCLATMVLSGVITGLVTRYARSHGMLDIPGARHSHSLPTPVGGGAGIICALAVATLLLMGESVTTAYWLHCLTPGVLVLGVLGWQDDRVCLSAGLRFSVQVLVSLWLLWCLRSFAPGWTWLAWLTAGFYLVWMTNLYNFMDGSNGMAGTQGVFAGLLLWWLFSAAGDAQAAAAAALMAAACAGFLPWNLGKARVFMGDVGSGPLGFAFAGLMAYGVASGKLSIAVAWMVMLVFVCDSTLTLVVRVMKGERWYNPHKQHLYQRLIARGWPHGRVLLLYQMVNVVLVVPAIVVAVDYPGAEVIVAAGLTILLGVIWSLARQKTGVLAEAG